MLAQSQASLWHGIEREVHYKPEGEDFVLVKGTRRFNRALYGSNTAFRVEAGDLPEFAMYLPGMGGNLKFGFVKDNNSKWIINATKIESRYRAGSMLYKIEDPLLGSGQLLLTVLALNDDEGMVVKAEGKNLSSDIKLIVAFGGATGTKFSRDGDIGADPESSFYLKPEYCKNNVYALSKNAFFLQFGAKAVSEEERYEIQHLPRQNADTANKKSSVKFISGEFPRSAQLKVSDAAQQDSPLSFFTSVSSATPALAAQVFFSRAPLYFLVRNGKTESSKQNLEDVFTKAEMAREQLAKRIKVSTPDAYINTLGGALSMAADAIWEAPSYLHGAVAWRMRLNGWRGPYVADVLGWHDRARQHFSSYALSQVTSPADGPVVMDTALHLGRGAEKMGTSLFSSGYISRNPGNNKVAHHYDMNLVFVDELLNHFNWTGDTAYVRQMWPLLVRHLDWEKRNFDRDGDGLYDAYAAIWASDALQYSGGGVAHSSAYNYRANKAAAALAKLIGENSEPYQKEADKILAAMQKELWLKDKGWFAEYKDLLGEKLVHPSAGLWTVYHAVDSHVPDAFETYQLLQYVNNEIPHIPVRAKGFTDTSLYTLSTTNWQPYTWSLNNVALAELLHTSLAYWQGGQNEEAFKLWKSSLVESMYFGASPGNFQQLSFYDAVRGELYRDFADPIGMAGRSLVEGLFGIEPDLLRNKLVIKPGFPSAWNQASLTTPDIDYSFQRKGDVDSYSFKTKFAKPLQLSLQVKARLDGIESVLVNGKKVAWTLDSTAVEQPLLQVNAPAAKAFLIQLNWKGNKLEHFVTKAVYNEGESINFTTKNARFVACFDPQNALGNQKFSSQNFHATVNAKGGTKTFFLQVRQGDFRYWLPVVFKAEGTIRKATILEANILRNYEKVDLAPFFNDDVKNIFRNQYFSPRPKTTTLQLPTQGIGNWAYPLTAANIDDEGLRKRAGEKNEIITENKIPFATPSGAGAKNIAFASQWDVYPKTITVPLQGQSSRACLLMAGSTNPMQSRMTNGEVIVRYKDGSSDTLQLKNPDNWWPVEQDYYEDGFAFTTGAPKPLRVYLKSGEDTKTFQQFITIKGFSNRGIDGGAATVLEMPLNDKKELSSLTVRAVANDVVIGLMALTLVR
ncbi:hypothetical protein GCM10023229_41950 [Flavisolibacter ginsenosidimutans]